MATYSDRKYALPYQPMSFVELKVLVILGIACEKDQS